MSDPFTKVRRVVVKVGSSLLIDAKTGTLKREWLESLVADVADLRKNGKEVLLVSSGAIALGRRALGLKDGSLRLEESQAAASVGQVRLAQAYVDAFHAHRMEAAQILLTLEDTEQRRRYLNARETLRTLLNLKTVPVINENDTVTTAEIRFGDNDRLAACVAGMIEADSLVLLSDIDGLYSADPRRDSGARHIAEVNSITPDIEAMAEGPASDASRGGMRSKIAAAKIATAAGASVLIANGHMLNPIAAIGSSAKHTLFVPRVGPAAARKRWIAGGLTAQGSIAIDAGAVAALQRGKSLLPVGVISAEGAFDRGDAVIVRDSDGRELARGLIAYNTEEARRLMGRRTVEIEAILGYRGRDEMIHRDDLAFTGLDDEEQP